MVTATSSQSLLWAHGAEHDEHLDEAHSEAQHSHLANDSDTNFNSVGQAWQAVQASMKTIESSIATANLGQIHQAEEELQAVFKYMAGNSTMVTEDKAKRLEAAIRQAIKLASNVHTASDAGDAAKTKVEFSKLQGALKLIEAQYPTEVLQATNAAQRSHASNEHEHHSMTAVEPTIAASLASSDPLQIGKKANIVVKLIAKKDGKPVSLSDLKEIHTEKIHLLIIDSSLTDYHHIHPKPTRQPGEYAFDFTPRKPGSYRLWADLLPEATGEQEYAMADIPASTKGEPISDRRPKMITEVDGLTFELKFEKVVLTAGEAILGKLRITDKSGKVFDQLEPVMGVYAHLVGFGEDYQSIAHVHPMGPEPTQASDRGIGELEFHLMPTQPGMMRLFAQVHINGVDQFAVFTLLIAPAAPANNKLTSTLNGTIPSSLKAVLDAYMKVQSSLAKDSFNNVSEAAKDLMSHVNEDKNGVLPQDFSTQVKVLAEAKNIREAREAFKPVSETLISILASNGKQIGTYFEVHCPMAPGSWIQADRAIKNPYYGASMLTCGSIKRNL